jgi:ankyrin repeat protein
VFKDVKNQYGNTILHLALSRNLEILKFLLSKPGIEQCFTIKNNYGNTPLHEAFGRTPLENREELLKHPKISISYDIPNNKNERFRPNITGIRI